MPTRHLAIATSPYGTVSFQSNKPPTRHHRDTATSAALASKSREVRVDANGRFLPGKRTRPRWSFTTDAQLNDRVLKVGVRNVWRPPRATAWLTGAFAGADDSNLGLSTRHGAPAKLQQRPSTSDSQHSRRPGRELPSLEKIGDNWRRDVGREYAGGSNSRRSSRQSRSSSRASSRLRALQERAAWQAQAARTAAQIKQSIMSEVSGSGAGFVQAFKIFRRKAADGGDGQVDFAEFRRALRFMNLDISEAEAQVVFDAVDTDGSGSIDYSEFCDGFMDKTGGLSLDGNLGEEHATNQARRQREQAARAMTQLETADPVTAIRELLLSTVEGPGDMLKAFKAFRSKTNANSNEITFEDFKTGLHNMHINLSPDKVRLFFNTLDPDGSGAIDYDEFQAGILLQTKGVGEVTGLGRDLGEEHTKNQARRQREQAAKLMTALDTEDPVTAIREHVMASVEGPGAMLKAFKIFRKKSNSLNNSITFREFAHGLHHMNVKLSATKMKMFFDSLDSNRSGEIDFAEFTAGIMRQANGGDRTSLR